MWPPSFSTLATRDRTCMACLGVENAYWIANWQLTLSSLVSDDQSRVEKSKHSSLTRHFIPIFKMRFDSDVMAV